MKKKLGLFLFLFFYGFSAHAAVFHFANGDRLTGELLHTNQQDYVVETQAMGVISVGRSFIEKVEGAEAILASEAKQAQGKWDGKMKGGLDRSRGNTDATSLHGGFAVHYKKKHVHEFKVEGEAFYSERDRKMNTQKYKGMIRYAYSFGASKQWYHYFMGEGDHDRFANIQARYTPSTGVGYWFADTPDWKAMLEAGLGVTFTDFRDATENETEMEVIPRAYLEKKLIGQSRLSQEVIVYPALTDLGEYRLHLDTAFTNPISEKLALKIQWLNDYNSKPGSADVKKHDMRLLTTLEYTF